MFIVDDANEGPDVTQFNHNVGTGDDNNDNNFNINKRKCSLDTSIAITPKRAVEIPKLIDACEMNVIVPEDVIGRSSTDR